MYWVVKRGGLYLDEMGGSKEGWAESDDGDDKRETFVEYLNRQRYGDGSTPLRWVEVAFGEWCSPDNEDDGAQVVSHYAQPETGDDYKGPADLEQAART